MAEEAQRSSRPEGDGDVLARHGPALLRYAASLLGDVEDAREVVQDAYARWVERVRQTPSLNGEARGWLFTVCRNAALDRLRRRRRMRLATTIAIPAAAAAIAADAVSERLERVEAHRGVLMLLATLPANQQEVVRLKFQAELSYKEIAEVTGLSVSHVGVLLHTAIRALRERLAAPEA